MAQVVNGEKPKPTQLKSISPAPKPACTKKQSHKTTKKPHVRFFFFQKILSNPKAYSKNQLLFLSTGKQPK
jgi:hypothetical protein